MDCTTEVVKSLLKMGIEEEDIRGGENVMIKIAKDEIYDCSMFGSEGIRTLKGVKALALALSVSTQAHTLTLFDTGFWRIGIQGVKEIANMIAVNKSLRTVYLNSNGLGENGMELIAKALGKNTVIRLIMLHNNGSSRKGGLSMSAMLKVNTTLRCLYEYDNEYDDEVGLSYAKILKDSNDSLHLISLGQGELTDVSAIAFAETLLVNPTITGLDLSYNRITDKGAIALANSVRVSNSLEYLDLRGKPKNWYGDSGDRRPGSISNNIGDKGRKALLKALEVNRSVVSFLHEGLLYSKEEIALLDRFLARNKKIKKVKIVSLLYQIVQRVPESLIDLILEFHGDILQQKVISLD